MRGLKGKVVIVTGAGQGIGRATALRFAEEGAHVAIAERNEESGQAVAKEIQDQGGQALFVATNVSDRDNVKALFDKVLGTWDKVDILVNNAGIVKDSTLLKMQDEQFDAVIDVNLKGTFVCASEAAALMKKQGSGVILNAASVVALYGNFGQSNYVASKTGVIGMTKVWSRELARYGVRVNAIAPGFIETSMTKSIPENIMEQMTQKIPMRRLGHVNDIAAAYAFLASDDAAYINGAVLSVDGGVVM